jgi:RHS repeat-associated protein
MADAPFALTGRGVGELGVEHTVDVDSTTGAAIVGVPIPLTDGRGGFGPSLSLSYDSGAGNSPFGVGWSLNHVAPVTLDTHDGLPRHDGSDRYAFSGDELVPQHVTVGGDVVPRRFESGEFDVDVYRGRTAGPGLRLELWRHKATRRIHWRSRDADDVVTVYGERPNAEGRVADPTDETRTVAWLPEAAYDPRGNAVLYEYMPEMSAGVDRAAPSERPRVIGAAGFAQRYLKRVLYGNTQPLAPDAAVPADNRFLFQAVIDYGDHSSAAAPTPEPDTAPPVRADPHSSFGPGFEVRTWRLARRILLFHDFEELGPGPTLVQITTLDHEEDPAGSTLTSIRHTGVRREADALDARDRPALTFTYASPAVDRAFQPAPEEASENVPQGLTGVQYAFVDLFGEGLPGILAEDGAAWYFKRNEGGARFGRQRAVAQRPMARLGRFALADFDRDGNPDLVVFQGRDAGWYEFEREEERWCGYRSFPAVPHLEGESRRVQLLDLTGDGRPDLVVEGQDRFTWFPSKGKEGFEAATEIPKPVASPGGTLPQIGEDAELDFLFADMNGDGLLDLVRVQNGRVEYWPQIGHGRFGDAVLMEDSPMFDSDGAFDLRRLQLVDLDGSGTADALYVGRGEIRMWTNASGNRFIERSRVGSLPYIEELSTVRVLDFLGDGTPCLVWSSPISDRDAPMHYLRLSGPNRPRLLLSVDNGMGLELRLSYSSSAEHYVRDLRAGRSWCTRLPSHPLVVERREAIDQIAGNRAVTRFEYHDGRYDGERRRFAGFGVVDRYEVDERPAAPGDPDLIRAAGVCTRTFLHPGTPVEGARPPDGWSGDDAEPLLDPHKIVDHAALTTGEYLDALRAVRGRPIREEVFALDEHGRRAEHPLVVTQSRWAVRGLEPARGPHRGAFEVHMADRLVAAYEGTPDDPCVNHHLALDVDEHGNVTLSADISYPRRVGAAEAIAAQARTWAEAERNRYVSIDEPSRHELGIDIECERFELWLPDVGAASAPLDLDDLRVEIVPALTAPLHHHEELAGGAIPRARRLEWERSRYWNSNRTAQLPLGQVGSPKLVHHEESACFTTAFFEQVYEGRVGAAELPAYGYSERNGLWWRDGSLHRYDGPEAFFGLARTEEFNGGGVDIVLDSYSLTPVQATDAAGNRWAAEIDYHVVSPSRLTDQNGNVAEVLRDPLGVVVVGTMSGHVATPGGQEPYGDDPLTDYVATADRTVAALLADPRRFLQGASRSVAYDLESWESERRPIRIASVIRSQLVHDLLGGDPETELPDVVVTYLDGFGRELQGKQLVEAGLALARDADGALVLDAAGTPTTAPAAQRWLASGHVVLDGRQQPVRSYEPFFTTTPEFEPEEELARFGVSSTLHHDALGRVVRADFANGTTTRVEYSVWTERRHDPNDSVVGTLYETVRDPLPDTEAEKQALLKARSHAGTPTVVHTDARRLEVRLVELAEDGAERVTEIERDAQGTPIAVRDPRGLVTLHQRTDMAARQLLRQTADGGLQRALFDTADRSVESWDANDVHERRRYDALGRLTQVELNASGEPALVVEQLVYGDAPGTPEAEARNARGNAVVHRDGAGVITVDSFSPAGRALAWSRQLRADPDGDPHWSGAVALAAETHPSEVHVDALGRVLQERLPDGALRRFAHARSGGVRHAELRLAGAAQDIVVLEDAEYDAHGQRIRSRLGNGVEVTHEFDVETRRTSRILARRTGADQRSLMDLTYTYDPVGNVVRVVDAVQQPDSPTPLLQGLTVSSEQTFTYDAWYQLIEGTGRVHQALLPQDYGPAAAGTVKGTRHLTLNNGAAVERYRRTYGYDLGGNLVRMSHRGATRNWSSELTVATDSNRALPTADAGTDPPATIAGAYDAAGNPQRMSHLRRLEWGRRGELRRAVIVDRSAAGQPDDDEIYEYGADGLRTRKVTRRLVNGAVETTEKVYLDGCEIKRIRVGQDVRLERTTSTVSDGADRLARIHRWTVDRSGRETDEVPATRTHFQLNNHLGSSTLELDEQGHMIAYEEYFPFGGSAFIASQKAREVERREYRYCGKETDEATSLVYFGRRYYQPWLGRWLSPDPSGPSDGQNLYRHVHNNPVTLVDWEGLQSTTPSKRGRIIETTLAEVPPEVVRAWGELSDAERANWRRLHVVWYQDLRTGRVTFLTPAQLRARSEAELVAGENLQEVTIDPDAGSGRQGGGRGSSGGGRGGGGTRRRRRRHHRGSGTGTGGGAGGGSRRHRRGATGSTGQRAGSSTGSHPQGGPADGNASSRANDPNAGGVNAGTGGNGTTTDDPAGAGAEVTGAGGTGGDDTSGGPGAGEHGAGPGGGGTHEGPTTGSGDGPEAGTGAEIHETTGAGEGEHQQAGEGTGEGEAGDESGREGGSTEGAVAGSPEGVPGGTVGGAVGGSPAGSLGGSLQGVPGGAPEGRAAVPGAQPGGSGSDPNDGTGTPGAQGGNGGGQGLAQDPGGRGKGGGGGDPGQQPSGGDQGAAGGGQRESVLDRVTRWAGYLNFEFSGGSQGGGSGGIPGGMGRWNLGKFGQILYIAVTVISTISLVKSLASGIAKLSRIGIRALLRRSATALRAALPAARGALTRALSAARGALSRPATAIRAGLRGLGGRFRRISEFWPGNQITTHAATAGSTVEMRGLQSLGGGRVWVSTKSITTGHVDDLTRQLVPGGSLSQGRPVHVITGRHGPTEFLARHDYVGTRWSWKTLRREPSFFADDLLTLHRDVQVHNYWQLGESQLVRFLEGSDDVVLAWCSSDESRRIMNLLVGKW